MSGNCYARLFAMACLVLLCMGCQNLNKHDGADWPRVSFEAGVLVLPQWLINEFRLDDSDRAISGQDNERSDWARTVTDVDLSLLLTVALSHESAAYRQAPRVVLNGSGQAKITFESSALYRLETDILSDNQPAEPLYPADLVLGLACNPLRTAKTGVVCLEIDVRLKSSTSSREQGARIYLPWPPSTNALDVWPTKSRSLSAGIGETWLISLPQSKTRQVVAGTRAQACRLFVFVRPALVRSQKEVKRLFPLVSSKK